MSTIRRGSPMAYAMWALALGGYIFAATCRSSLSATGIQAALYFDISSSALSSFVYLQLFVYAIMQIPAGMLLDRFGPKAMIVAGCCLMSLGQGLLAVSTVTGMAVVARAIVGAGDALIFISVIRLLAAWFPLRRLPLMNQLTGQIGNLGQIISVYPFVWVMNLTSWQTAFLSLAGVGLMIAFCVMTLLRESPANPSASAIRPPVGTGHHAIRNLGTVARMPGTVCGFWVHSITWFSNTMMNQLWGFPFLLAVERYSYAQASAYLASGTLSCVVLAMFFGRFASSHPVRGRVLLVYGTVGAQMLCWTILLLTEGPHSRVLMIALLLAISSGMAASSLAFDFAREANAPRDLGTATGLANIGGFLSSGLVLLGVGLLLDWQGADNPNLYSDHTMRIAVLAQYPIWIIGLIGFSVMLPKALRNLRQRNAEISAGSWTNEY
ncbi:MFS transporter [Bifidobacterium psychraerophilum]|uniref:MFS transporter n=1 Tax=Bifidobacterium psychraerophilum TaxID=218140 RepID=UPI0023F53D70|nr:MFS transporter [Bifidobacterium psychraerophilum]MCI1659751.1 MFS transporter [Bifidobacterium psychraerophilum]MCI1804692.1 MFS transporter [Bifidobacterium psychraerophilum]MCI2176882.1 MFS transporter [Bifidobacterium psychraerophilum]MCI2182161.1 MFS transporter [Bifidobacterium psychraerophilum]